MEFYISGFMQASSLTLLLTATTLLLTATTLLLTATWMFLENPNKAIDQTYVTGRKVELVLLFAITLGMLAVAFKP